jgi:hypothetical protein
MRNKAVKMNAHKTNRPSATQRVLARRVRAEMIKRYPDATNDSQMIKRLHLEAGLAQSTIQRIISPEKHGVHATKLHSIEALAIAFRVETYSLLMPSDE